MPCEYGSEKKPSAPDSGFIYPADYICNDAGQDSAICKLVRFSPGGRFPIDFVLDVAAFCEMGEQPIPTGYDPSDVIGPNGKVDLTGLFDKNQQLAYRAKFSEWCQCKGAPSPSNSGQCADSYCLYVRVIGTVQGSGAAYDTGPNRSNSGLCGYIGPIGQPYIAPGNGGFPNVFVQTATQGAINVSNVNGINVTSLIPDHYRQNGLPDNCVPEPNPPTEPDPPPSVPNPPNIPPFNIVLPDPPSQPGPAGPAGPAGSTGARGATGPCPGLSGTVQLIAGATESLDINLVGDCEYEMNLVLPSITTESKMLLFGVEYVVTYYPPNASYNIQEKGLYFIPRSGAIRFSKTGTTDVSENFELHGEKGFVVNPRPQYYNNWEITPFTGFEISVERVERQIEVATDLFIPDSM